MPALTLTTALLIAGGVVLLAVIMNGWWTLRRARLRAVPTVAAAEAPRTEPTLEAPPPAPELGAELSALHAQNPEEFWARGGEWVKNAKTGISIATRADDAATANRWRALVRFGNGVEETVEFTKSDGKLVLADL